MVLLQSEKIQLGWEAAEFELPDTKGNTVLLEDFKDKKGLLIVFTCNHCPYAKAAWPILNKLYEEFGDEIGFVGINPNDEVVYPEDSYEIMQKWVNEGKVKFTYLRDKSQKTAKAYRAQCTPDPYLFRLDDGKFKLFYHGRINDNWQDPEAVKEENLKNAIQALLKGESPPANQPPSMGCSIKWK